MLLRLGVLSDVYENTISRSQRSLRLGEGRGRKSVATIDLFSLRKLVP